ILITGLNEPDGTHRFFMLARLDGLALASYSSDTREVKPLREWAAQAVGASYLRKKTQDDWDGRTLRQYPAPFFLPVSPPGIHTLQLHVNCALDGDTPVRGQFHFAFDGQDFLILERNQSAWVPLAPGASNETHFWNAGHTWTLFAKEFLQEECVDTLKSLLRGGMEALGRQVPPGISVTYRDAPAGSATLSCHARGFYPRPIHVSWVRDGAEILPPMNASGILPHADGTYQIRQSLEIPPRWGHGYACRVNHSSLGEPAAWGSVSSRDVPFLCFRSAGLTVQLVVLKPWGSHGPSASSGGSGGARGCRAESRLESGSGVTSLPPFAGRLARCEAVRTCRSLTLRCKHVRVL
uniref:Ig-like domain-containing protein n=1 Tax=Terrapene triunguis TaxID=2587831 RepID=A0A674JYV6_9SAUR